MIDRVEDNFGDDTFFTSVRKYEKMVEDKTPCFFDVFEFEDILGYYLNGEETDKAKEVLDLANSIHPQALSLRIREAQLLLKNNEAEQATELLKLVESIDSTNPDVFLLKGCALAQMQQYNEAQIAFDSAIALAEDDISSVACTIAEVFESEGKYKRALKYFLMALHADPTEYSYHNDIAFCCDRIGNYEKAIIHYKAFIDEETFSDNTWFNLGFVYSKLNDVENALEAYNYCLAINENHPSALFNKANILMSKDQYDEAIETFNQFLEQDSASAPALCYMGECYDKLGQTDLAMQNYRKSLRIDEEFSDAWHGLAKIMFSKEMYEEAIHYTENAIGLDQDQVAYWTLLGDISVSKRDIDKAINSYKNGLMCDAKCVELYVKIAEISLCEDNYSEAYNYLKDNYLNVNNSADANYILAACSYKIDDIQNSLVYLENGLSTDFTGSSRFFNVVPESKLNSKVTDLYEIYKNRN